MNMYIDNVYIDIYCNLSVDFCVSKCCSDLCEVKDIFSYFGFFFFALNGGNKPIVLTIDHCVLLFKNTIIIDAVNEVGSSQLLIPFYYWLNCRNVYIYIYIYVQ